MNENPVKNDNDKTKRNDVLGKFLKFLFCIDLFLEIRRNIPTLKKASKIYVQKNKERAELEGGTKKRVPNPFNKLIFRYNAVAIALLIPMILYGVLVHQVIKQVPSLGQYFAFVIEHLVENIEKEASIATILLTWTFQFKVTLGLVLAFILTIVGTRLFAGLAMKNDEIRKKTELVNTLAARFGYIKPESGKMGLWTPIGVLLEVDTGSSASIVEDQSFWTQISLSAGRVDVDLEKQYLFFINTGFKLPSRLEYSFSPTGQPRTRISF